MSNWQFGMNYWGVKKKLPSADIDPIRPWSFCLSVFYFTIYSGVYGLIKRTREVKVLQTQRKDLRFILSWTNPIGKVLVKEYLKTPNFIIQLRGLWWLFCNCRISLHRFTSSNPVEPVLTNWKFVCPTWFLCGKLSLRGFCIKKPQQNPFVIYVHM